MPGERIIGPMRTIALAAFALMLAAGCSDDQASTRDAPESVRSTSPTASPTPATDEAWAVKHCRDEVLKQIDSPASAQWPGGEQVEPVPGSTPAVYRVFGDLDAQNGLGALTRRHWSCEVTTGADTWTVEVKGVTRG